MADRIFKGHMLVTELDADENRRVFPEAAKDFNSPHAGGLIPFDLLKETLIGICDENMLAYDDAITNAGDGSFFVRNKDIWIKIDSDGTIEIGAGAA